MQSLILDLSCGAGSWILEKPSNLFSPNYVINVHNIKIYRNPISAKIPVIN